MNDENPIAHHTSLKVKWAFFFTSLIVSLGLLELFLNIFIDKFNQVRVFKLIKESQERVERIKRSFQFEVAPAKEDPGLEILAIGDSYTNGGNVSFNQSYPYLLWEMNEGKATVTNMGVCESSTALAYDNLKRFLEGHDYDSSKKYLVTLLVGAADIFADSLEIDDGQRPEKQDRYFKRTDLESENTWVMKVKVFRLISYLWYVISEDISEHLFLVFNDVFYADKNEYKEFFSCFVQNETRECLRRGHLDKTRIYGYFRRYAYELDLDSAGKVKVLMTLFRAFPQILEQPDPFLSDLVVNAKLQSLIPMNEVITVIEKAASSSNKLDKLASLYLQNIRNWGGRVEKLKDYKRFYFNKILSLVEEYKNINLFLLTYPLNFSDTNEVIKELAARSLERVYLVDLEDRFKPLLQMKGNEKKYFDDWQHCTPLGYALMAKEVLDKIRLYSP